jgi:hypothetical protein
MDPRILGVIFGILGAVIFQWRMIGGGQTTVPHVSLLYSNTSVVG